jgi:hypothetical protein
MVKPLEIECNSEEILNRFKSEGSKLERYIRNPSLYRGRSIADFIEERARNEPVFSEQYLRNILEILKFSIICCKVGHQVQLRKTNVPFETHPINTVEILIPIGVSYVTCSGAANHDRLEEEGDKDIKERGLKVTDFEYHLRFLARLHGIGIDYFNFVENHIEDANKEIYYKNNVIMQIIIKHLSRRADKNYLAYLHDDICYPNIKTDFRIGYDIEGISYFILKPYLRNFEEYYGKESIEKYFEINNNVHFNSKEISKIRRLIKICKGGDYISNSRTMPRKNPDTGLGFLTSKRLYELFKGLILRHEINYIYNRVKLIEDYQKMMRLNRSLGEESIIQLDSDIQFIKEKIKTNIEKAIRKDYNSYRATGRWRRLTFDGKSIFDKTFIRYVGYLLSENEDDLLSKTEQDLELLYQDCLVFKGMNIFFEDEFNLNNRYPIIKGFLLKDLKKYKIEDIAKICGSPFD